LLSIRQEIDRLKRRASERPVAAAPAQDFVAFRTDPARYCAEVLHVTLTPQQVQVCDALVKHRWILVPSANEVGKSFLQACLASWHYDCFNPSQTIITAPAAEQIRDTVFAELRARRLSDPGFMPSAMILKDAEWHWVKGYTAKHATAFHGRHFGSVFVNFEEAEEIPQEFWVAADSMAHFFCGWYNPILTSAETVNRERSGKYHIVRLSALDHPNIAAGLQGLPPPFPAAITLPRLIERLDKWATRITEDDFDPQRDIRLGDTLYRPGPIAEARVLGRRPTSAVGTVFGKGLLDSLLATRHVLDPFWPRYMGVDVARFGDDNTVFHGRQGACSTVHESHNGWTTVATIDRAKRIAYEMAGSDAAAQSVEIRVDDIGVGGGVSDQLIADGYNVIRVVVSETKGVDETCDKLRSQLWFDAADLVTNGLIDLSRIPHCHADLIEELGSVKYDYSGRGGTRKVDPKKVTKAALGRSPDNADAFLLAYFQPRPVTEQYQ
jgi:hypothetical protein